MQDLINDLVLFDHLKTAGQAAALAVAVLIVFYVMWEMPRG